MGNYKDYGALIDSLVERGKPFLIVKYCLTSMDRTNSVYEVVTIGSRQLNYTPIERKVAIKAIRKHELPLLHEMDSRNMIWGDEQFKERYKKKGVYL
jgi:hypothetical protein